MPIDMHALALSGAKTRLAELREETDALLKAFPQLKVAIKTTKTQEAKKAEPPAATRKPAANWTAAQRRAVSERMKKYWAARRKASKAS